GMDLQILDSFAKHHTPDCVAGGRVQFHADGRARTGSLRSKRSQVNDQVAHFAVREIEGGHAATGRTGADKRSQFDVIARPKTRPDRGAERTAIAVAPMTTGTAVVKQRAAGARVLRRCDGEGNPTEEDDGAHQNLAVYMEASTKIASPDRLVCCSR